MNPNADRWLELYNEGMTIEEISLDHGEGYSSTTVGANLRKHPDYVPRPARGSGGSNKHNLLSEYKPSQKPTIIKAGRPGARATHRRRGRGW